jgi:hypothetical protein
MRWLVVLLVLAAGVAPASAQNWSFDARKIGMGATTSGNVLEDALEQERGYRAIVVPLGLFQVLRDLDVFRPGSDRFDLARSIEYASAPLHYVFGRNGQAASGRQLAVDLRNAALSRDLNAYRGFVPVNQPVAEGLASPQWGVTLPVWRGSRVSHGLYLGAGPYLALRTALAVDQRVIDILGSDTDVYLPNAQLQVGNVTRGEAAIAITAGYRGRVALAGAAEGGTLHLTLQYSHLQGLRYEHIDSSVRFDTDAGGLLTFNPLAPFPLLVARDHASSGRGRAVDLGVGVVVDRWEAGFSARGIGNRIDWRDGERTTYMLPSLFGGSAAFAETAPLPTGDVRVTLPVDWRVSGAYRTGRRLGALEFSRGFQGSTLRFGLEEQVGVTALRAGSTYVRGQWQPTAGLGLRLTDLIGLDLGVFGTSANAERVRRAALAVSFRINPR